MKVFLSTMLVMVGALYPAMAQYTNTTPFSSPPSSYPQIDSTNFVNLASFSIEAESEFPFTFSDVLYYTNRSLLYCTTGFIFEDQPSNNGTNRPSTVFGNAGQGTIEAGPSIAASDFYTGLTINQGAPVVDIWATNVVNAGLIDVGAPGVMQITGNTINLDRGTLQVEGFVDYSTVASNSSLASPLVSQLGVFDDLFGIGLQTNVITVAGLDPSSGIINTPSSTVRYLNGFDGFLSGVTVTNGFSFTVVGAAGFAWVDHPGVSNLYNTTQVVLVNTNLTGISVAVHRQGGGGGAGFGTPYIQWQAVITNSSGLPTLTNYLYLSDAYGANQTNTLTTNGYDAYMIPQLAPFNYVFSRTNANFTNYSMTNTVYNAEALFGNAFGSNFVYSGETNAYSAYEVSIQPVTFIEDSNAPGYSITNTPGQINISASTSLDLTGSKIEGPNYLNISSTNHFVGATNALIIAPYIDLSLGSTNGNLSISNLVYPFVPRFQGAVDMYSARWTNFLSVTSVSGTGTNATTNTVTETNTYVVTIVNADLSPTSQASVDNLVLRSTNITVSDALDVTGSASVNATSLTITTNGSAAPTPIGEMNLLYPDASWSTAFPNLQYLTNYGYIELGAATIVNLEFSVGSFPEYSGVGTFYDVSPSNRPYATFVNHGYIFDGSTAIWANYAENSSPTLGGAVIEDSGGTFSLQASNAVLYNSYIVADSGDASVTTGSLSLSNEYLEVNGALTLAVSNSLTDGGLSSTNYFYAYDGFNLLAYGSKTNRATGDFLDTIAYLNAPAEQVVYNTWAASDLGAKPSGFHNNAAVGELILDGGDANSQFYFSGPDTNTYALYVDLLVLENGATNRSNTGGTETFNAFGFGATNFTIYFADAQVGGNDISEKLNGANGGQLIWVPAYAGRFSSTNLVYPAGVTNTLNRGLVLSTDIDSDADGIVNALDSSPVYTARSVNFSIGFTNLPPLTPGVALESAGQQRVEHHLLQDEHHRHKLDFPDQHHDQRFDGAQLHFH